MKTTHFKNTSISYTDQGKGTAIVLLHGFLENKKMWDAFIPEWSKKFRIITIDLLGHREICVCHRCDNPRCVNPEHLFLGSHQDNMSDKMTKGRCWNGGGKQGENHPCSTLTETQVREIRGRWAAGGIKQKQLAVDYGVNYRTINQVVNMKKWKHLE